MYYYYLFTDENEYFWKDETGPRQLPHGGLANK
jgi:hypothetical protein